MVWERLKNMQQNVTADLEAQAEIKAAERETSHIKEKYEHIANMQDNTLAREQEAINEEFAKHGQ